MDEHGPAQVLESAVFGPGSDGDLIYLLPDVDEAGLLEELSLPGSDVYALSEAIGMGRVC